MLCALAFGAAFGYIGYEFYRSKNDPSFNGLILNGSMVNCSKPEDNFIEAWGKKFKEWWEEAPMWMQALTFGPRYAIFVYNILYKLFTGGSIGTMGYFYIGVTAVLIMCILRTVLKIALIM
jgi:hypothetical protein